ncbi:MAG: cyclic nucleotide-binding domain-containing protein, partial [Bacteroidota bacterium]
MDQYTDQNSLYLHFPYGKIREYHKGHTISDLHLEVKTFKWLLEGAMDYFITLEDSENTLLVCQISETLSALGHNGLHAPGRYTYKAVVASDIARFFEIPIADLKASIATDLTNKMLKGITTAFYGQLRTALLKQTELLQPVRFAPLPKDREFFMSPQEDSSSIVKIMRCSPFLDQFQEDHLLQIAEIAERREYEPDELLYVQDQFTNGLYIMIEGTVSIKRITGNVEIKQRSITNVGFIFGWSCFLEKEDICNAITTEKTGVYFISYKQLRKVFKRDRNFERHFFSRLLWLISNQMNAAFLRYAGLLGKHNLQAVQQLIGNSKSRVPLNSPLHKVSHLLKNVNTKEMAYSCLHSLLADGSSLERHIASLSLDLLRQDREELHFMQRLQQVYKTVANHPCQDTGIVRKDCAKATRELFKDLDYRIEGWENLPETSGHIFLYNHLLNHRHYTLNNNFQITLDSHFISALILDKKYGDPGIRTVRIGRGQEYGHQNYYKKLGHINVYTPESEATSPEWQKKTRSVFYEQAKAHLQEGINILISP